IVLGANPFEVGSDGEGIVVGIASIVVLVTVVAICFLKGRRLHGIIGILFAPLALYGACRIGKPDSAWAHHRYGTRRPKKQAKAERRFHPGRRADHVKEGLGGGVGGTTRGGGAAPRSGRRSAGAARAPRPPGRHPRRAVAGRGRGTQGRPPARRCRR